MTTKRSGMNLPSTLQGGEFPFIDHAKSGAWAEVNSATWTTPFHQCIDAVGHVNTAAGKNKQWFKLFYIPTPTEYAGSWTIDWTNSFDFSFVLNDGSVSVSSHTGADFTTVSAARFKGTNCSMTFTLPGNTDGRMYMRIEDTDVNSTGAYGGNFRFYRTDQASLLPTKIWNPDFKNKIIALNPAVLRLVDYQNTIGSLNCRWENRCPVNYNGWTQGGGPGHVYFTNSSYPDATGTNIYTVAAIAGTPAALTHGELATIRFPNAIVRGGSKTVTAVTKANPGVASSTAHGYQNGDLVQFYGTDMTQLLDVECTVANVTANTFELQGVNTTAYTTFTTGTCAIVCKAAIGGRASKQMKMRDGYTNIGVYSQITANSIFTFMYDKPTDSWLFSEGIYIPGIPPEILLQLFVELAAETTRGPISPWFCIPHMAMRASDTNYSAGSDYLKNLITLLKNGDGTYGPLPAACDIWLEPSCETWNFGAAFWETPYLARVGFLRWGGSRVDAHNYSTLKAILYFNDAVAAYGAGSSRIKRVMAVQAAGLAGAQVIRWDGSATITGDALNTWGDEPARHYDYLAPATYIEPSDNTALLAAAATWNGGADPAQIAVANAIFASSATYGTAWFLSTMLPVYKAVATTYGLSIAMYEGGWGPNYSGRSTNEKAFFDAIKANSNWANTVVLPFWNAWNADAQCSLPYWYTFSGHQTWGLLYPDLFATTPPAYTMMKDQVNRYCHGTTRANCT